MPRETRCPHPQDGITSPARSAAFPLGTYNFQSPLFIVHPQPTSRSTSKDRHQNSRAPHGTEDKISFRSDTGPEYRKQFKYSDLFMGHPQIRHPLIYVAPVRQVPFLPPPNPPKQCECSIQDEIRERQDKNRKRNRCSNGGDNRLNPEECPEKRAARIRRTGSPPRPGPPPSR